MMSLLGVWLSSYFFSFLVLGNFWSEGRGEWPVITVALRKLAVLSAGWFAVLSL